ncbi:30S ribosomal protein S3 [Patescibacteria group bacterium]|nr:30S ribosomal protein S3 [Patescibacteria group bacterium]
MGQKVHPTAFRLGKIFKTKSTWYADAKSYPKQLLEDNKIRRFLENRLNLAGLTHTEIKRSINTVDIHVFVSRPGVVIGRGGSGLDILKKELNKLVLGTETPPKNHPIKINIHPEEVQNPDVSSALVLDRLISQIERRYPHRRAVSQAIEKAMSAGAKGIKVTFSGRINGADIARTETYKQGRVPTQTIRANIDYSEKPALTRSGYVGIKVWVYTGDVVK